MFVWIGLILLAAGSLLWLGPHLPASSVQGRLSAPHYPAVLPVAALLVGLLLLRLTRSRN